MNLERIKRGIRYRLGRYTSEDYCNAMRDRGVKIGKGTVFFDWKSTSLSYQRPWLVEIGEYCKICAGTIILEHDYSRSVLRRKYGEVIGEAGKTIIGNNVFIGMNSIILMGTKIGNNVIVGAGSVVTGNVPDDVVIAGNPAKIIRTLDEHYRIRKEKCLKEAVLCAKEYMNAYGRKPTIQEMGAFFPLYLERSVEALHSNGIQTKLSGDEEEEIIDFFLNSESKFSAYDDFINILVEQR